jgi:hypothetical protein
MANKTELEARKAELTKRLAKNSTIFLTSASSEARKKAQAQSKIDLPALENVNKQLEDLKTTKVKPKQKVQEVAKELASERFASNVPDISEEVIADLVAGVPGIDFTNKSTFGAGGIGSTSLVYFGEKSKSGGLKFEDGKPVSYVTPTTGFKNTVITDFWKDEALQNKIISSYAAKGKSITQVEAYGIWQTLVNTAAEIYQGGRGGKVTPMQLLSDTLKSIKGDEPTLPRRSIAELDKAEYFSAMDKWASSSKSLMRTLKDYEKEDLFAELEKLNKGTVTTYNKVKNKKTGKMENVERTTPGLTPEKAQATVEQRLMELNPDDADRAARIRFADFLSGSVEGV